MALAPARDPARLSPTAAADARTLSASLPDLLVEARQIAASVAAGWHGRRRAGTGEDFWQFRPFGFGEPARRIDWRRSARDDSHLYVRETEMENAHSVWLWTDLSASMRWSADPARVSKRDRALILMIALGELLARSGERIGLLGTDTPIASRNAAERLARDLAEIPEDSARAATDRVRRHHDVVIFSDFLDAESELYAEIDSLSALGARVHLVQIMDPVEESFPFLGRTEFIDPESGARLTAGRAEAFRTGYLDALAALRDRLAGAARLPGWGFMMHHTDRPASECLLALHEGLAGGER